MTGKFCGHKSLVSYSLWGCKESDMTECTHTHTRTHYLWYMTGLLTGGNVRGKRVIDAKSSAKCATSHGLVLALI